MPNTHHEHFPPRIERLPAVLARTSISRSSLYALLDRGAFPTPVKLSERAIGFLSHEVDAWILERASARSQGEGAR